MSLSKARVCFSDGSVAVFNRAEQFEHGCGRFVVLHLRGRNGEAREISFDESSVVSTELVKNATQIGFRYGS